VYSEADVHSLPVHSADEAICIGPANSRDSYLNIPAIISAALISGAQAIHPGYGFLSENADFSEVCKEHGLVFIGPPPEVLARFHDKSATRAAMKLAAIVAGDPFEKSDAAGRRAMLDAAAIIRSSVDIPTDVQAGLMIRAGYLALRPDRPTKVFCAALLTFIGTMSLAVASRKTRVRRPRWSRWVAL